jgi:hypothetical protein
MHQSDSSETTAELIFWYWNDKEIAILEVEMIVSILHRVGAFADNLFRKVFIHWATKSPWQIVVLLIQE